MMWSDNKDTNIEVKKDQDEKVHKIRKTWYIIKFTGDGKERKDSHKYNDRGGRIRIGHENEKSTFAVVWSNLDFPTVPLYKILLLEFYVIEG